MKKNENSFYLFQCNSPNVNRKFITFIYGSNYLEQLGSLQSTMIFQVSSTMPDEWNKNIYIDIRKKLLPYELAHKMIAVPVYNVKHDIDIWNIIMGIVSELNAEYINS
jgi:hypothetical protein